MKDYNDFVQKYSKMFKDSCWDFSIGKGWYSLVNELCRHLQWDIDKNNYPQIKVQQVKEKFGGLRFYVSSASPTQYGAIDFAEKMSWMFCEVCGTNQNVITTEGWLRRVCKKCLNKEDKKMAKYYDEIPISDEEKLEKYKLVIRGIIRDVYFELLEINPHVDIVDMFVDEIVTTYPDEVDFLLIKKFIAKRLQRILDKKIKGVDDEIKNKNKV